jgi:esterase/lipase superfamily enzyme
MIKWRASLLLLIALTLANSARAQTTGDLIRAAAADLVSNGDTVISLEARERLAAVSPQALASFRSIGRILEIIGSTDTVSGKLWQATGRAVHDAGLSDWQLVYSQEVGKIVRIELTVTLPGQDIPPLPEVVYRGVSDQPSSEQASKSVASLNACEKNKELCRVSSLPEANPRVVEFLFATTRAVSGNSYRVSFSGERGENLVFGAARVRVPEDHKIGKIELPSSIKFFGFEIYEQKLNPDEHFIIKEVRLLDDQALRDIISAKASDEALVFIHGYNNSFDDSLYRMAQIVWDLQYRKVAVLFTWPSRGSTLDYIYDQQSALTASSSLSQLLKRLRESYGIKRIHIIAHSMGNLLMMEALKGQIVVKDPIRIAELIMAAPDVDRDYYRLHAPEVRKICDGMTLYASSNDKTLQISRKLAGGIPRAGDVPPSGPILVSGVDAIDVSVVGADLLGLNHDVFASHRQVMDDIGLVLNLIPRKTPSQRLVEIHGVPDGSPNPQYWRYGR